jgi:hypothetical protein
LVSDIKKEHRLRVFENRVLRRIFEPKKDEVTGDWRKLQNEELHDMYSSPSKIKISSQGEFGEGGMWHECGRRGTFIGY